MLKTWTLILFLWVDSGPAVVPGIRTQADCEAAKTSMIAQKGGVARPIGHCVPTYTTSTRDVQ